jgi:hypothetical protein
LENFFGCARQQSGNAINPTPIQFRRAFRKLFVMNYIHSETMNCAEDFEKVLLSISTFKATSNIMLGSDVGQDGLMEGKAFVVENCDYHKKTFPEVNAFKYVCGYLIKKCLQNMHEICKS